MRVKYFITFSLLLLVQFSGYSQEHNIKPVLSGFKSYITSYSNVTDIISKGDSKTKEFFHKCTEYTKQIQTILKKDSAHVAFNAVLIEIKKCNTPQNRKNLTLIIYRNYLIEACFVANSTLWLKSTKEFLKDKKQPNEFKKSLLGKWYSNFLRNIIHNNKKIKNDTIEVVSFAARIKCNEELNRYAISILLGNKGIPLDKNIGELYLKIKIDHLKTELKEYEQLKSERH